MSDYSVQIIDSPRKLEELKDIWNELLSRSSADSIFLTWEWLSTWAEIYIGESKELFVLLLMHKNKVVCIAPWCIRRVRYGPICLKRIEFLGGQDVGSDYLDVIARAGREKALACHLYDFLMNEVPDRWDCLLFRNVPANSIFYNHFIHEFEKAGKDIQIFRGACCPIVILPGTKEDFIASLRPHRRRQCNRHWRLMQKMDDVEYTIERDPHLDGRLGKFLSFYEKRWGKKNNGYQEFLEKFALRARSRGWLEVESIRWKDAYIAAILHIFYNGTKFSYLTAVDKGFNKKVSAGNVLIHFSLLDAIGRNMGKYNFLKGTEPYKYHWANSGEQLTDMVHFKHRFASMIRLAGENLKAIGKIIFR